jgi:hypothetical protein
MPFVQNEKARRVKAGCFRKLQKSHPSKDTAVSGHRVMVMMEVVNASHEITV